MLTIFSQVVAGPCNWYAGWSLVLAAFLTGAVVGLFFHRDEFLGGYSSFPRRIVRLGHVALAALGILNVLFSIATPATPTLAWRAASVLMMVGGASMPAVCFLTGWRTSFRHLFFIPVASLIVAVVLILFGGTP